DVQYLAGAGGIGRNQGGRVFVLKLGGNSEVPPPPPPVQQVLNPPDRFGTAAALAHGRAKYQELGTICHEARRNVGGFPDLRYSPYLNSDAAFHAVVMDGVLADAGMLPFSKVLNREDAEAIRAHLVSLAHALKSAPGSGADDSSGAGGTRSAGAAGAAGAPRTGPVAETRPPQPAGGMGIFAAGAGGQSAPSAADYQEAQLHQ